MGKQAMKVRRSTAPKKRSVDALYSVLILLLGIALGIFAKWLDNLPTDSSVWWHRILDVLDLRNVFSAFAVWFLIGLAVAVFSRSSLRAALNVFLLFVGMCVSYHWYTVTFCGFNPYQYMLVWYGITLLSPLIGWVCWFSKGTGTVSIVLSSCILMAMMLVCFSFGLWYFDFQSLVNILLFAGAVGVLYVSPKATSISVAAAFVGAFLVGAFL